MSSRTTCTMERGRSPARCGRLERFQRRLKRLKEHHEDCERRVSKIYFKLYLYLETSQARFKLFKLQDGNVKFDTGKLNRCSCYFISDCYQWDLISVGLVISGDSMMLSSRPD